MSWITNDWRLKLLALGLSVLMLGAVAFSQNPPTIRTLSVGISYSTGPGIVVIDPPLRTNVTFQGLADVIATVTPNNLFAVADAQHVLPGPDVKLNVAAHSTVLGVTVLTPAPIAVDIDTVATVEVPLTVKFVPATEWQVTKTVATCPGSNSPDPCKVHFTGPKSWTGGLTGQVVVPGTVNYSSRLWFNLPIGLATGSGPLDISRVTSPLWGLDYTSLNVDVEASTGITFTTVPLVDSPPSQGPPAGYQVVKIDISPNTVVITGDQAILGGIQYIRLPAVDLSSATSTISFQVNIPYRPGVTSVDNITKATITYVIARNPAVSPSP
jgi:hypothetical protein